MKGILGFLLLLGIISLYWKWIVALVVVVWIVNLARRGYRTARAEAAEEWVRRAQLVERADREHAQVMAGDERGIYGRYTPYKV
jgi:hypothetical protein